VLCFVIYRVVCRLRCHWLDRRRLGALDRRKVDVSIGGEDTGIEERGRRQGRKTDKEERKQASTAVLYFKCNLDFAAGKKCAN